jgi:hypothetical protein
MAKNGPKNAENAKNAENRTIIINEYFFGPLIT